MLIFAALLTSPVIITQPPQFQQTSRLLAAFVAVLIDRDGALPLPSGPQKMLQRRRDGSWSSSRRTQRDGFRSLSDRSIWIALRGFLQGSGGSWHRSICNSSRCSEALRNESALVCFVSRTRLYLVSLISSRCRGLIALLLWIKSRHGAVLSPSVSPRLG